MDRTRMKRGAAGGLLAGVAMGMWMMVYYWFAGLGFWEPLGYIGHFLLRDADITAPLQVFVGMMIHMMMSLAIGMGLGTLLPPTERGLSIIRGAIVGLAIWVVMQYGVLNLFDEVAFEGLVAWAFAVGHVIYGGVVGAAVAVGHEAGIRRRSVVVQ